MPMADNELYKLLGQLTGEVQGINKRLDQLNGSVKNNCQKLQKHEVLLGKAGLVFATIVFVASTAVSVVINWVKNKFF